MCVLLGQTRQSKTRSLIRGRTETFTRTGPHFFSVALRVLSFFFSLATYLSCWRLGEPRSIDDSLPTPQGNQIVSTSAASSSRRERDRPTTPSPAGHLCRGVRNGGLSDRGRRGEKRDRFTARICRHNLLSSPAAVLGGGGGRVDLESKGGQALQNPRPSHQAKAGRHRCRWPACTPADLSGS